MDQIWPTCLLLVPNGISWASHELPLVPFGSSAASLGVPGVLLVLKTTPQMEPKWSPKWSKTCMKIHAGSGHVFGYFSNHFGSQQWVFLSLLAPKSNFYKKCKPCDSIVPGTQIQGSGPSKRKRFRPKTMFWLVWDASPREVELEHHAEGSFSWICAVWSRDGIGTKHCAVTNVISDQNGYY